MTDQDRAIASRKSTNSSDPAHVIPEDTSSTATYIIPDNLALVILIFSIFFAISSITIVTARIWVRARAKLLGPDDGLMTLGLALYLVSIGLASYATFEGLGTPIAQVNVVAKNGLEYVMIWQLFYMLSLVCIKNSICITLLRIAVKKVHRLALYTTITVSTLVFLVGFIGDLTLCRPVSAQWTQEGECAPRNVIVDLNYVISIGAIVTDWACAIIPACILWNAQMKRDVKFSVGAVLALGSLASLSTFARLPFLKYYNGSTDFLYKAGHIVLWSVFEGGIGLVAGSLPMLRQFFKRCLGRDARDPKVAGPSNVVTIGGSHKILSIMPSSHRSHNTPSRSATSKEQERERLDDSSVDLHRLHHMEEAYQGMQSHYRMV